ncbi:Hypothetical protein A7982_00670 [Minicystis rosea]|nr:Hypothetical protein A7982_00670 [Minicystis rosea]
MTMRPLPWLLALALSLAACSKEPTRWDQAASSKPTAITAEGSKPGSAFNKFFPADSTDGHSRVYTAEKPGYAEAKLKKDGKDVAVLSISDTLNEPDAKSKFASASEKVRGYPLVTVGKNQSALLVKDRYQVKVSSQSLDADARKAWIERFDLAGLGGL